MIAAQSAGPAVALGSAEYLGLNETEPGETNTIKEGIEAFDPEYNKGANYFYLGDPKKEKDLELMQVILILGLQHNLLLLLL